MGILVGSLSPDTDERRKGMINRVFRVDYKSRIAEESH